MPQSRCHHHATPVPSRSARRCSPRMAGTGGEAPVARVLQCRHSRGPTVPLLRSRQASSRPAAYIPPCPAAGAGSCMGDVRTQSWSHTPACPSCLAAAPASRQLCPDPRIPAAVPATRTGSRGVTPSRPLAAFVTHGHPVPPGPGTICCRGASGTPARGCPPALSPQFHADSRHPRGRRRPRAESAPSRCRAQGDTKLSPGLAPAVPQFPHCWGMGGLLGVWGISALLGLGNPAPRSSSRLFGAFPPRGSGNPPGEQGGSWAPRPPRGFLCCSSSSPFFSGQPQ